MMDEFEKNIRENSEAFNEPGPDRMKLWDKIEGQLPAEETVPKIVPLWRRNVMKIAAGLALLIGLTLFFTSQQKTAQMVQSDPVELQEVNNHYGKLVALQVNKLRASNALSEDEKVEFLKYIDELSAEQQSLKSELQKNLDNEEILKAIVDNFNQQINLIEQLLDRLDQKKSHEDDKGISL